VLFKANYLVIQKNILTYQFKQTKTWKYMQLSISWYLNYKEPFCTLKGALH